MININGKRYRDEQEMKDDLYRSEMARRGKGGVKRPERRMAPTEVGIINDLRNTLAKTKATPIPPINAEPIKNWPSIPLKYHEMGELMGMSPFELHQIMEQELDLDNPLIMAAFKRLVLTIKMATVIDFGPLNARLDQHEESYQRSMLSHHNANMARETAIRTRDQDIKDVEDKVRREWALIVDGLVERCQGKRLSTIKGWDRVFINHLVLRGRRYCKDDPKAGIAIQVGWCKKFEPPVIFEIQSDVAQAVQYAYDEGFREWLYHSEAHELRHELWHVKDNKERQVIQDMVDRIQRLEDHHWRYRNDFGERIYDHPTDDPYR